jgi:hypothetical protein
LQKGGEIRKDAYQPYPHEEMKFQGSEELEIRIITASKDLE